MSDFNHGLRLRAVAFAIVLALGLAGCGGGSNVKPSPAVPVPPPATGEGSGSVVTVAAGTTLKVQSGDSIAQHIVLESKAVLDNAGTVGGTLDIAVDGDATDATVLNHDGGSIKAKISAVMLNAFGTVENSSGGIIDGGNLAVGLGDGGLVGNDGAGSIIRSVGGMAVRITGDSGTVENTGGATITSGSTAIYLAHGGKVVNGVGSTIETTGTADGDCATTGACAIFAASGGSASSTADGGLTLSNAGTIIGNVQMIPGASNFVTLSAGSLIRGNLEIGPNHTSSLTLNGDTGTSQYSQAVIGTTTFAGDLIKGGNGTWIIDNDDLTADTSAINAGTLQIGNGGSKGSIGQNDIAIHSGKLAFDRSDTIGYNGIISGSGSFVQAGTGTLTLTGANSYTGGTTISHGTLQLGDGGNTGSILGDLANNGFFVFNRSNNLVFAGIVTGTGSLGQAGTGTLTLTGTNSYTGGTTISAGMLQIGNGGTSGSISGDVANNATLAFDRSDDISISNVVTGTGRLIKAGNGALTLSGTNDYTGTTQVNTGSLYVDGDQSAATGATTVASGAVLGGKGTLGGGVTLADGATLAPGSIGAAGTLTINGDLNLSAGSTLNYAFGQANTVGGALNDLTNVNGNLTLDGTLNVNVAPGGNFGPGVYRVFNYAGTLVNNGLAVGSIPTSSALVQTAIAHQVNLINADNTVYTFWDGDFGPKNNNAINGGRGTWEVGYSLTLNNWTDANGALNAPFSDRSFAIFQATPGRVTVDTSNGDVNAAGMQFDSDGYVVQGDAIHLVGTASDPAHSIIRVGDGTAAGAGYTATIDNVLDGGSALVKTDAGTLVLAGGNTYTGGTSISGGTLRIGAGGVDGSITGDVMDNGSLVFDRSDDQSFDGNISGNGSLEHLGRGTLTLTGTNTYTGSTTVNEGTLQIGNGGTTGSIVGDVIDNTFNGSLVFNRSDDSSYAGVISGSGGVVKKGDGTLTMSGANTHTGGTTVQAGTLKITAGGSQASGIFVGGANQDATLQIDKDATVPGVTMGQGGRLDNAGAVVTTLYGLSAVRGYVDDSAIIVLNHDGGLIESDFSQPGVNIAAINLGRNSTLVNSSGSTIRGYTGVATAGIVNNSGGSITGMVHDAISGSATLVNNTAGAQISSGVRGPNNFLISSGVNTLASNAVVNNLGGSTIAGRGFGTHFFDGGTVTNDGGSFISGNSAIFIGTMSSATGSVINSGGSTIKGTAAGIVLQQGGTVINGAGSTIEATATPSGDCSVTLACSIFVPIHSPFGSFGSNGTLDLTNAGAIIGSIQMDPTVANTITLAAGGFIHGDLKIGLNAQSTLTLDGNAGTTQLYSNAVTGTTTFGGSLVKSGGGTWIIDSRGLQDVVDTSVTVGSLQATQTLSGNVTVNASGTLDGVPGIAGDLSNFGKVAVHGGDSHVGGNYVQSPTGTLAVSLGSKLDVSGSATLNGGVLKVIGADSGYVSNTHTDVLAAAGGVTGTFAQLVKATGVVFTASTINYTANSVWLDTTGLNVTTAAAGNGVTYTPASMGSAQRVQGAFEQLNARIAAGNLSGVSDGFLRSAGQFQLAPSLQAAQTSLQSLSGQLHAVSAAMTFTTIDASSRALSDRFDDLLGNGNARDTGFGTWMQNLNAGGNMARAGFDGVGYQLNGWMVGGDRQLGRSGVAGYAFSQSRGQQHLQRGFDYDNSRSTEGMLYAGWLHNNWYTLGRVGFGRFQQDVSRRVLLGESTQGVQTQYGGRYDVAYGESGLHFDHGRSRFTPFVNVQYARINRDGFAESGAGGFGLRSNAQALDRWQAGLGVRAAQHWDLGDHRSLDFNARAQWQRTLASRGDVFDASFVGLQQWHPLAGVGLSRYSSLFGVGMNATLSAHTALNFNYDYETGQNVHAQMLSAQFKMTF